MSSDPEDSGAEMVQPSNLRSSLKLVRDPCKTAYDFLPNGETLGSFANRHALERYKRKVESKRERARETRKRKRRAGILAAGNKKHQARRRQYDLQS